MIRFACPSCREQLEGEDELRGRRMACPGCSQEIQVPGGRAVSRPSKVSRPTLAPAPPKSDRPVMATLLILTVLAMVGAAGFVAMRKSNAGSAICLRCDGKGRATCVRCDGSMILKCWNPGCDRGKVTTQAGVVITCLTCGGEGTAPCRTCKGTGDSRCAGCRGTGRPLPR